MTGSTATRLSLISRIRQNDSAAWTELVDLYEPLVKFWCRRHGIVESDVHDLAQEVFFSISRSIERYQPTNSSGSFRGWLWGVTRHKMIDALRRQQRQPVAQGGSTALHVTQNIPDQLDEQDALEKSEFGLLVHRALEQVRAEFETRSWQAFWRTTIDGQTVAVVAEQLSLNPATVRQHRSRILRRLRQQLGEGEEISS
ncbi:MAG: sigma-70 family RNA polymerase sigma factor [Pirellulales bacterium]